MGSTTNNSKVEDSLLFEILGFEDLSDPNKLIDPQEIRKHYMRQVLRYHPDKTPECTKDQEHSALQAEIISQLVDETYRILCDKETVLDYIKLGRKGISEHNIDWNQAQQILMHIKNQSNKEQDQDANDATSPTEIMRQQTTSTKKKRKVHVKPSISNYKDIKITRVINHRTWGDRIKFSAEIGQVQTWLSIEEMIGHHKTELQTYLKGLPKRRLSNLIDKNTDLLNVL